MFFLPHLIHRCKKRNHSLPRPDWVVQHIVTGLSGSRNSRRDRRDSVSTRAAPPDSTARLDLAEVRRCATLRFPRSRPSPSGRPSRGEKNGLKTRRWRAVGFGGGAEVVLVQRTMKGGLKLGCKWEVATPRAWCEVANTSSEPSVPGRLGIHQTVR